ncbi:hypothetical protein MBLNU459_g3971t2 [Dothideomycetes sp. NU459]
MASTDASSLRVDAPRRGLAKLRRRKDNGSNSSKSSIAEGQDGSNGGLRASIDGAIEKLKDRRRRSSDDRRGSGDSLKDPGRRLSTMSLTKRRRRKNRKDDDATPSATYEDNDDDVGISPSPSELSLGLEGSGHSSLLTEDSDDGS